jgi:hypothetical protein
MLLFELIFLFFALLPNSEQQPDGYHPNPQTADQCAMIMWGRPDHDNRKAIDADLDCTMIQAAPVSFVPYDSNYCY